MSEQDFSELDALIQVNKDQIDQNKEELCAALRDFLLELPKMRLVKGQGERGHVSLRCSAPGVGRGKFVDLLESNERLILYGDTSKDLSYISIELERDSVLVTLTLRKSEIREALSEFTLLPYALRLRFLYEFQKMVWQRKLEERERVRVEDKALQKLALEWEKIRDEEAIEETGAGTTDHGAL